MTDFVNLCQSCWNKSLCHWQIAEHNSDDEDTEDTPDIDNDEADNIYLKLIQKLLEILFVSKISMFLSEV